MSTLKVVGLQNPASGTVNGTLNADGTTTFNGVVTFATGQTFPSASSTLPPASPTQGSTWYDTATTPAVLKVWNGSAWVPVSSSPSGTSAPSNPSSGTTWYDTSVTPPQMKVWNGSAWVPMPATATSTAPTSPTTGQQWTDTSQNPPVLKLWNGSAWVPATVALGTSAPTGTLTTGQLWSDTSTTPATLKAWNGSAWVAVQASGSGGIPSSLLTAKGSIISASAANTPVELATGTNGQVLTVDTTTASGLKWAAAGGTGTVTSVTGTAPIAVATGTTTPVISITQGTARQLLQTNAGATGVEFASNIDVPGTLDVTGVATFDNIISAPLGSAAAPSVTFTGDINTGLFSPGADQLGLTTAGTQRITVGATGDVTVTGGNLTLNTQGDLRFADSDSSNYVAFQAPATVAANVTWTLPAADGTSGQVLSTDGTGTLNWATAGGITEADLWEVTGSMSGGTLTVLTGARSTNAGFALLGTGMSYSAGVFTFPSTGTWQVVIATTFGANATNIKNAVFNIQYSSDNGGTWTSLATQSSYLYNYSAGNQTTGSVNPMTLLTITNTAQQKIRYVMSSPTHGDTVQYAPTIITFTKLAS